MAIWEYIQKSNPIWFFDSTGCIFKNINQKDPQLYSIIIHDKKKKQLVPLFEFIDTERNEARIQMRLKTGINLILKMNEKLNLSSETIFPKIVVVDNAWAMINSVCMSLNKMELIKYLCWCYEVLINNEIPTPTFMVIIYLCQVHLEKIFLKAIKKFKDGKENKLFLMAIYAFTLIQNSIQLDNLNTYLKHVHIIFCSEYNSCNVSASIDFIRGSLKCRFSNEICFADYLKVDLQKDTILSNKKKQSSMVNWWKDTASIETEDETLIKASPFKNYFEDLFKKNECFLNPSDVEIDCEKNPFFKIEIFTEIKRKLYLCPMWTGLMLDKVQKKFINIFLENFFKLDNNQVESYIGDVQYNMIKDLKNLYPSEYSIRQYIRIKGKFLEFFETECFGNNSDKSTYSCNVEMISNEKRSERLNTHSYETSTRQKSKQAKNVNISFLKLKNVRNNCYVNSGIQCFFSLGNYFFDQIHKLSIEAIQPQTKDFYLELLHLKDCFENKDSSQMGTFTTSRLIQIVDKISKFMHFHIWL